MGLPSFAKATVIVLRAPTVNDHGTDVPDWTSPDVQQIAYTNQCLVVPAVAAVEDTQHRDATLAGWNVGMPPYADVLSTDHVLLPNGKRYAVIGEPAQVVSPTGALDYIQLHVEWWKG